MKTKKIIFVFSIILLIFIIYLLFQTKKIIEPQVCIKQICFQVEVAQTQEEREIGLMYRKNLGQNKGMLFIFPKEGIYSFWMKNTLIPLDIIWIDLDNKIIEISKNIKPCKNQDCELITPEKEVLYVLEINSGLSDKFNFSVGEKVEIKL